MTLKKLSAAFIKQEAVRARTSFGLNSIDHVPYGIDGYVDRLNASIVPKINMKKETGIDACWGENFKELYIDNYDYVNSSSLRWRFTIAHELGHYFLHNSRWVVFKDKTKWMTHVLGNTEQRVLEERDANIFGAYFLMPDALLESEIQKVLESKSGQAYANDGFAEDEIVDILSDQLAQTFNVTDSCMKIRISNYRQFDRKR